MFSEFHFLRPLWLLAALPLGLLIWYLRFSTSAARVWEKACDAHLLRHLLVRDDRERHYPLALLAVAWLAALLALAGPTWTQLEQPVYKGRFARVLVMDLSSSMDAADLRPSRLSRARFKALDILERSREGQTALIVYAQDAYVVSPLTDDANTISALVPMLVSDLMPAQGSDLGRALSKAGELLDQAGAQHGEVLVITDGVSQPAAAQRAAAELSEAGARVSVLGVGTREGAPIPLSRGGFLKDADGAIVIPKLDPAALRSLARAGGGRYATVSGDDRDVTHLVTRAAFDQTPTEEQEIVADRWREEGIWLVLALLPLAALSFRRGWLLGFMIVVSLPAEQARALEWADLWSRPDERAAQALAEGQAARAARQFQDSGWRATAHYRAGEFDQAADAYTDIDSADAHYNRGNALAHLGQFDAALAAYDQALTRAPSHADAIFNRTLIEQLMEQQVGESGQSRPHEAGVPQPPEGTQGEQPRSDDEQESESGGESRNERGNESTSGQGDAETTSGGEAGEEGAQMDQSSGDEFGSGAQTTPGEETELDLEARAAQNRNQRAGQGAGEQPEDAEGVTLTAEAQQALEQWLRRIPDDPGGLWRRKFLLEYRRRQAEGGHRQASEPW